MNSEISSLDSQNNFNDLGVENFENKRHYSLFTGYQDTVATPVNLNRYPNSNQSSPSVYTPKTFRREAAQSTQVVSPRKKSLVLVQDVLTPSGNYRSITSSLGPQGGPANLDILMQIANRSIRKLQEKGARMALTRGSDPRTQQRLATVTNRIASIKSVADRETAKVKSSLKRKYLQEAQ